MARAAGAFATLPVALVFHAVSESMAGHFRETDTRWALMLEVLTMSSGPGVLGVNSRSSGLLLAYRGHLTEARATGLAQVRESAARGQGGPADIGRYIIALADLFGGDYAAAMSHAQAVIEDDPAYTAEVTLPELIEAAIRAGIMKPRPPPTKPCPNARWPPPRPGRSGYAPAARRCWLRARTRRAATWNPSASSSDPGWPSNLRVLTCSTANGCAGPSGGGTRGRSCASRMTCSPRWVALACKAQFYRRRTSPGVACCAS